MHLTSATLRDFAPRGAREAALELLRTVRSERHRLDDPDDDDALHDFRVALRRLRSWLRAFHEILSDTLSKRDTKALKAIADATRASRDLEVHIEWIGKARRSLRGSSRQGAAWLLKTMERTKSDADACLRGVLDAKFDDAVDAVQEALERYQSRVDQRQIRLAEVVARVVRAAATDLRSSVGAVSAMGERPEAHAARIRAKRLRYLLDPLDDVITGVSDVVEELTAMQEVLGDLHDAQMYGAEIVSRLVEREAAGDAAAQRALTDLSRRLRRREQMAFAAAAERWLNDDAAPLLARVAAVASWIDRIARDGREIERKFLLRGLPADLPPAPVCKIRQGYLPGEHLVERLRSEQADDRIRYFRTVKVGSGVDRVELEDEAGERLFRALWPFTKGRRVLKRRHRVAADGLTWEIDEFLDRKLVVAEVELDDPDAVPVPPPWLERVVDREVTGEEAFDNQHLAR